MLWVSTAPRCKLRQPLTFPGVAGAHAYVPHEALLDEFVQRVHLPKIPVSLTSPTKRALLTISSTG